jgi:hypothetical protein
MKRRAYGKKTNARYELIRFSSFSYRFLGASCAPAAAPATTHGDIEICDVTNGKELTFVKAAFGVHWEDHPGWSMGERMGMGPDTSRARSVRVTEKRTNVSREPRRSKRRTGVRLPLLFSNSGSTRLGGEHDDDDVPVCVYDIGGRPF